ncbi:hypothetical protein AMECASPLE_019278 [Ameca splendens]|uniref:Uncharacterized protein n=1 Tax=Ameca splendens TaxID=208324 RepID=A0ABV0XRX2_9TELE
MYYFVLGYHIKPNKYIKVFGCVSIFEMHCKCYFEAGNEMKIQAYSSVHIFSVSAQVKLITPFFPQSFYLQHFSYMCCIKTLVISNIFLLKAETKLSGSFLIQSVLFSLLLSHD